MSSKPSYGGQAVIEGVMMRGTRHFSIAVRHPSGKIVVHTEPLKGRLYESRVFKLPLIRGVISLWDSLSLGMRALMYSANVSLEEDEDGESAELSDKEMWGTVAVAISFAIALFFVAPAFVTSTFLDQFLGSSLMSNLVEKVIRLALVIGYIVAIGMLPDISRVFAYHGAEHKAINAFEAEDMDDVKAVARFSTAHPRCGTSFLLVVVVISFIAFSLLGQPPLFERLVSRVVLIPVVAAVAYEFIKFGAAHSANPVMRALMAPGMWLQKLTTREPDEEQVEVAMAALRQVIAADAAEAVPVAEPQAQVELGVS